MTQSVTQSVTQPVTERLIPQTPRSRHLPPPRHQGVTGGHCGLHLQVLSPRTRPTVTGTGLCQLGKAGPATTAYPEDT